MGRYWLVLVDTGSVWGGTGWYLVVLGQYKAVLGQYKAVGAESIWVSGRKSLKRAVLRFLSMVTIDNRRQLRDPSAGLN